MNLPAQLSSFVGRASELDEVATLISTSRLVTLTGAGGSGKTRLALEVARSTERFADGVWLVDLVKVTSPDQLPGAFAAPFLLGEQSNLSMQEVVVEYLRGKSVLLVVDNCEHLVEHVASLVEWFLMRVSGLHVLATSREPLAIAGEITYVVSPLAVPESDGDLSQITRSDAVRLFVERASATDTRFELTAGNAATVAHICRRLDGIPLALELAAGMLRTFDLEDLRALVEEHFDALAVAPRSVPTRHKTLRAAIDWSYDLLLDDERTLFRRLSVFQGGFDRDAAESACSDRSLTRTDVLIVLDALVSKSLVSAQRQPDGGTRYAVLETLRDYGRRRLEEEGEVAELKRRHATHYRDLAEQADAAMRGPEREGWIARLGAEGGNMRAALSWSLEFGDVETGLRLAAAYFSYGAVFWFWDMRSTSPMEGLRWLRSGLSRNAEVRPEVRAKALQAAGFLAESYGGHQEATELGEESLALYDAVGDQSAVAVSRLLLGETAHNQGEYERATVLLEESLADFMRLGETWNIAWAQHRLGMVARLQGDYGKAIALHEQSLERFRALGDRSREAYALWSLGVVARYEGNFQRAGASCEESLRLFEESGERPGIAHVRSTLGDVARLQGDDSRALSLYEECRSEFQDIGDRRCAASMLSNIGAIAQDRSDYDRARSCYEDSLAIRRDLRDIMGVADCLDGMAMVHAARGDSPRAAQLMGAAEARREGAGGALSAPDKTAHEAAVSVLRGVMGAGAFDSAWREGRALSLDAAIDLATVNGSA
jgi:predicted ATPase